MATVLPANQDSIPLHGEMKRKGEAVCTQNLWRKDQAAVHIRFEKQ